MIHFGDTHDWLRLTSGEWLKGRLKRLREDEIELESDKLDVVGRAVVTADQVLVETADGVQRYPRSELLSIVDGEPRERNWWSSKLGLGLSVNTGNTNQASLTAYFELTGADSRTRAQLRYDGTMGVANGEQNVDRHIGTAMLKLFLSQRWYFTPAAVQFLNDRFQNIRFRATPGAGAGVHVFDTEKVEWDLEAGLGYQFIEYRACRIQCRHHRHLRFRSVVSLSARRGSPAPSGWDGAREERLPDPRERCARDRLASHFSGAGPTPPATVLRA